MVSLVIIAVFLHIVCNLLFLGTLLHYTMQVRYPIVSHPKWQITFGEFDLFIKPIHSVQLLSCKMIIFIAILLLCFGHSCQEQIKVFTTEDNVKKWNRTGKTVELQCPNLKGLQCLVFFHSSMLLWLGLKEVSICGRFKTHQFLDGEQHILNIDKKVWVTSEDHFTL